MISWRSVAEAMRKVELAVDSLHDILLKFAFPWWLSAVNQLQARDPTRLEVRFRSLQRIRCFNKMSRGTKEMDAAVESWRSCCDFYPPTWEWARASFRWTSDMCEPLMITPSASAPPPAAAGSPRPQPRGSSSSCTLEDPQQLLSSSCLKWVRGDAIDDAVLAVAWAGAPPQWWASDVILGPHSWSIPTTSGSDPHLSHSLSCISCSFFNDSDPSGGWRRAGSCCSMMLSCCGSSRECVRPPAPTTCRIIRQTLMTIRKQ